MSDLFLFHTSDLAKSIDLTYYVKNMSTQESRNIEILFIGQIYYKIVI
jgi:hypothetical protein